MGDLVKLVRQKCPVGVSHTHNRGNPEVKKNNKMFCFLCDPKGDTLAINFSRFCPNAKEIKSYILTLDQKCAIYVGFQNLYKKYSINVPPEIFMILNDILRRGFIEQINLRIDSKSINHMMSCRQCSNIFMDMIDNHACNNHMLPRRRKSFFVLNNI